MSETPMEREEDRSADDLVREMNEKAEAEIEEIERETRARIEEIEQRSQAECERIEREAVAEAVAGMKAERDRIVGEVLASNRAELLEIKRTAVEATLAAAAAAIDSRIGGGAYAEALGELIREGISFAGDGAVVTVAEEDLAICRPVVDSLGLDCTLSGGADRRGDVVVESGDGRRRVENGLSVRLERAAETSLAAVARRLFE